MVTRQVRLAAIATGAIVLGAGVSVASGEPLAVRFAPAVNVSDAEGLSDAPAILTDAQGRVFAAWEERSLELVLLSRSDDGAATFSTPVPIAPSSPYLSFGQIALASLGAADVGVACTAFDLYYGGAEIIYAASIDAGQTFSEPVLLSPIDNFNSYAPDIAAGWAIAVAWSDFDVWTGITKIHVRVSTDGGATFSEQTRADDSFGYACCPSVALGDEGEIFVAWQEKIDPFAFDDAYEVMLAKSADGGATFGRPINVSHHPQPSSPPRMVTDESGSLYVLWEEGDYLDDMKLLLVSSQDGASSFSEPVVLEGPVARVFGNLAVAGDGALWVSWITWDDVGNYAGRVTRSLDAGASFATPATIPGDCGMDPGCRYPVAATSRSRVFVASGPAPSSTSGGDVFVMRGDVSVCGDADDDEAVTATDALIALSSAVGLADCSPSRCDVDDDGAVSASDALAILNAAVGIPVVLSCPA